MEDSRYVVKTDVTAYFEYVDHELLRAELLDQTGEEPTVDALLLVLGSVLGRLVGLPQVHPASDILGDCYIDPVRRRLIRRGYTTFMYADDFRIVAGTLGQAGAALEACSVEVRRRALVSNERKTFTYRRTTYEQSLGSYAEAERRLFEGDEVVDPFGLGFLNSDLRPSDLRCSANTW